MRHLPARSNHIFVGNGEQISFLIWQLDARLCDWFHGLGHVIVAIIEL